MDHSVSKEGLLNDVLTARNTVPSSWWRRPSKSLVVQDGDLPTISSQSEGELNFEWKHSQRIRSAISARETEFDGHKTRFGT